MAPVIKDDDLVLAESTAIVQYIAHKHGGGRLTVAPESKNYADYLYWLQFNNNSQTGLFVKVAISGAGSDYDGGIVGKIMRRRTEGLFQQMNDHLAVHTYLAGDEFTLADVMSAFVVVTLPSIVGETCFDRFPNIRRYAEQITRRPAWQKAMDIAGPNKKSAQNNRVW